MKARIDKLARDRVLTLEEFTRLIEQRDEDLAAYLFEKAEANGKAMIESLIAGLSKEEMTVTFR